MKDVCFHFQNSKSSIPRPIFHLQALCTHSAFPTDHLIIEQAFPWVGCWGQSPFPLGVQKALFGSVCHHCCGWNWSRGTDACGDSSPREKCFWLHLLADFSMKNKQQWFGFSILWIKQKQPHSWSEYRFLVFFFFSGPILSSCFSAHWEEEVGELWGEGNWVSRKAPESLFSLPFLKQLLHNLDRRISSTPSTEGFKVGNQRKISYKICNVFRWEHI